ncbi:glycosyltransferase family 2 protein [Flavobacterium algicola]|uniref:glycosyltransferase family 2 protein n=1 Tax=Flavobacterium algicola TaxID=556529 RepID=UPI001EFCDCA8|nr:glycosyltransferase family A protein [Flavobacterium algicola]MCG9793908.1 glycosyltransferase family 2 protein [Flavobacterium algicola]
MNPKLSIIIPCYNSSLTLNDTIISVISQSFIDWEIILVNDGSTDNTDTISLAWSKKNPRIRYFSKKNEGLAKTRNFAISKADGKYILPLDSDNLVEKDFARKAIEILDSNQFIGVVHGNATFFGEKTGVWKIDKFDFKKILAFNYIDACAIYRKALWDEVGGYDENMPFQGHEDWDFWIKLGLINVNFQHLNEITFKYFVSSNSMIRQMDESKFLSNQDYLTRKYTRNFHNSYVQLLHENTSIVSGLVKNASAKALLYVLFNRIKNRVWKK